MLIFVKNMAQQNNTFDKFHYLLFKRSFGFGCGVMLDLFEFIAKIRKFVLKLLVVKSGKRLPESIP